ncbi:MAG TPA: hypothetical protein VFT14_03475 [Solirubrobacterales bacterium]|nr:hypothetical protein [Solirubrobacterales bacterium]
MDRKERREHVERLLDDIRNQRKIDMDEVLMELIHLVLELEDEVTELRKRLTEAGPGA